MIRPAHLALGIALALGSATLACGGKAVIDDELGSEGSGGAGGEGAGGEGAGSEGGGGTESCSGHPPDCTDSCDVDFYPFQGECIDGHWYCPEGTFLPTSC